MVREPLTQVLTDPRRDCNRGYAPVSILLKRDENQLFVSSEVPSSVQVVA